MYNLLSIPYYSKIKQFPKIQIMAVILAFLAVFVEILFNKTQKWNFHYISICKNTFCLLQWPLLILAAIFILAFAAL